MLSVLRLPLKFDADRLKADLRELTPEDWAAHFNTQYYEGDWSGVALRTTKNSLTNLYPDPTATEFEDTPMLARCSYVQEVLRTFECPLETVRFLRLGPGAAIKRHRDFDLGFDDGVARIHIPVKTNHLVEFFLDDQRIVMGEGEAWYLNFNLYHSVENKSAEERIHLVIDCIVNDWLASFFQADDTELSHKLSPNR